MKLGIPNKIPTSPEIRRLGKEAFFPGKIRLEIFCFQTMSKVDVSRYFLVSWVLVTNEYDRLQKERGRNQWGLLFPRFRFTDSSVCAVDESKTKRSQPTCLSKTGWLKNLPYRSLSMRGRDEDRQTPEILLIPVCPQVRRETICFWALTKSFSFLPNAESSCCKWS